MKYRTSSKNDRCLKATYIHLTVLSIMKSILRILTSGVVTALYKNLDAYNLNHCDLRQIRADNQREEAALAAAKAALAAQRRKNEVSYQKWQKHLKTTLICQR